MKSLKYTLAVSLLAALWPIASAQACWSPWYLPRGYYMYRVLDPTLQKQQQYEYNPGAHNNCLEWQRYTSPDIPLADIYQVVYKMPLEEFEQFCEKPNTGSDNKFLAWLARKAPETARFLLFAKITEDVRSRQNSRWYYPSMHTGARMALEEIAETALAYRGPLRDRYLLQAVRAIFSLRRYAECVELWETEVSRLPKENIMRQLIQPYIAGAEEHLKHYDRVIAHYNELGEEYIYSMITCKGEQWPSSAVETIERVYGCSPNNAALPRLLQEFVHKAEPDVDMWDMWKNQVETTWITPEHRQLVQLAVRIAQEGKTDNPAMWYYTAAFIEDLDGHAHKASLLLAKAEQAHGTDLIKNSVKVMRIYLDAKLLPYTQAYEKRLQQQLQWLDGQIANHLTPEVRERTAQRWNIRCNISYYYWNDMLRRILLSVVCPRMLEAGKPIRALQLANMADNRLFNLVDRVVYTQHIPNGRTYNWIDQTTNMQTYRYDRSADNAIDYSNHFFEMIDSLGLPLAMEYRHCVEQPRNAFDRFLNERGYVNPEYLDDIVGTQCLRVMRYEDAVAYLGRVSRAFEGHLNTSIYWDPFSNEHRRIADKSDFKYRFAREMWMLEQEIAALTDPDRKAERMIRYAIGLKNSFDSCWSLTQYYRGKLFYGMVQQKRDWPNEPEAFHARTRVQELIRETTALFTDRELAAKTLYKFNQYRTVAEKYPDTETGRYVRGACDNLKDYAISVR